MTVKLYQAVGEITLLSVRCLGDRAIWLGWTAVCSMSFSLHHCFKCVWSAANDRVRLVNEFVQSVYATGSDAATPNRPSEVECTSNNRLIKDFQHLGTYVKQSQLPQKMESPHFPVVHIVSLLVQSVVDMGSTSRES